MSVLLTEFLMQPEATSSGTAQPAPSGPDSGAPPSGSGGMFGPGTQQLLVIVLMFGVFYFLLIRPQQKRQREMDNLLKSLKKGDIVRTSGGIRGEIVELTDQEATLLIAEKVKINILRSHVSSKVSADAKEKP
ncbi:MAG TPA: preprotein translocase subunit YajC [Polyangiales bacterium]|nr:preprotein translocase subunit YajC [Polyangiales bacterium]